MSTHIRNILIAKAKAKHGDITLCSPCMTTHKQYIVLWYNDTIGSTHIVKYDTNNNQ